jgi:hypothetical protein
MRLFDWLFNLLPYLCAIAQLANISWNFRAANVKDIKLLQQANPPH